MASVIEEVNFKLHLILTYLNRYRWLEATILIIVEIRNTGHFKEEVRSSLVLKLVIVRWEFRGLGEKDEGIKYQLVTKLS